MRWSWQSVPAACLDVVSLLSGLLDSFMEVRFRSVLLGVRSLAAVLTERSPGPQDRPAVRKERPPLHKSPSKLFIMLARAPKAKMQVPVFIKPQEVYLRIACAPSLAHCRCKHGRYHAFLLLLVCFCRRRPSRRRRWPPKYCCICTVWASSLAGSSGRRPVAAAPAL